MSTYWIIWDSGLYNKHHAQRNIEMKVTILHRYSKNWLIKPQRLDFYMYFHNCIVIVSLQARIAWKKGSFNHILLKLGVFHSALKLSPAKWEVNLLYEYECCYVTKQKISDIIVVRTFKNKSLLSLWKLKCNLICFYGNTWTFFHGMLSVKNGKSIWARQQIIAPDILDFTLHNLYIVKLSESINPGCINPLVLSINNSKELEQLWICQFLNVWNSSTAHNETWIQEIRNLSMDWEYLMLLLEQSHKKYQLVTLKMLSVLQERGTLIKKHCWIVI